MRFLAATATALAFGSALAADPGVSVVRTAEASRLDAVLPGSLVSFALPRFDGATREIIALVRRADAAKPDDPCAAAPEAPGPDAIDSNLLLVRVDRSGEGAIETLREGLPAGTAAIDSIDLDGDGADELLLGRPGHIDALDFTSDRKIEEAGARGVVDDPGLAWVQLEPRSLRARAGDREGVLRLAEVGALRVFAAREGRLESLVRAELPIEVEEGSAALYLESPVPRFVGIDSEGRAIDAADPEPVGTRRLRAHVVTEGPPGPAVVQECWCALPTPSRPMDHAHAIVRGRPALIVTTISSEKLSFFGEKTVAVFPLEPDRTRAGRPPLFLTETRINMWQSTEFFVFDANGDGREDLILGYWQGILGTKLALDVYLGKPEGGFEAKPKGTSLDIEDADRSFVGFGSDVTGDGLPDLVTIVKRNLEVYPGIASRDGKNLLSSKRALSVQLPAVISSSAEVEIGMSPGGVTARGIPGASGPPAAIDLDADGRPELLIAVRNAGGNGLISVFKLHVTAPSSR
jgi:hypothetical protein